MHRSAQKLNFVPEMWVQGGKRHGIGIYRQANDYSYEGEWANDQISGQGRETYPNGDSYDGGFLSGMRHGFGCYRTEKVMFLSLLASTTLPNID